MSGDEVVWPPTAESAGEDYPAASDWIQVGADNWISRPSTSPNGQRFSWWAHRSPVGRNDLGRVVFDEPHHRLVAEDPIHIEPSLLCAGDCGVHGFIRDGKWVPA